MHAPRCLAALLLVACSFAATVAAERDGHAAARQEIAKGPPVIWEIGRLAPNATPDAETGLPRFGWTCEVNPENEVARDAHNDEIRRAVRAAEIASRPR